MKRILTNAVVVLMATLAMISCKSSDTVDPTVTLSDQTVTLTQKDTYQLTAELSDYSHDYVVWASNNSEVASVSQEGLVTAVAPGTAEITAKCEYGKNRQTCTVTVNPIYVSGIKLDQTSVTKKEGETVTLKATITPSDATYQTVTWSTSDAEVATVSNGVVSCIGAGTATITVATANGATSGAALTATCTVNVKSSGNFVKWMDDKAGSKTFITEPASDPASGEWISYDGNKITWTANTTGKPRKETLTLSTGSVIEITQFEEGDIVGDYTFVAKVFKGTTGIWSATNTSSIPVNFKIAGAAEGLQDVDGNTHINNIEISGLFDTMILPAAFEFSYDAKTSQLGVFLDTRNGQGQATGTNYGVFFPGICSKTATAWGSPWYYNEVELGTPDYTWLWFDFDVETGTFSLKNRTKADDPIQELKQYSDEKARYMCGFGVILCSTNVFDRTTFPTRGTSGYANFFQMNSGKGCECFERK